ncbi:MAG: hypothetical protein GF333_05110 [Candidatus Omnitrophica bacterium]|nr:hypothetical protein [Candidatus Omnitrophota bacterium]
MALRPTDIQIVLQATRNVGKLQQVHQQHARQQQEHLSVYMQKNLEEKKKRPVKLDEVPESNVRPVSGDEKGKGRTNGGKRRKKKSEKKIGGNVDLLV